MNLRETFRDLELRDLILPTAVFIGGAVLGRMIGLRPIWRSAVAAVALANAAREAGVANFATAPATSSSSRLPARRRKTAAPAARKRTTQKKTSAKTA